MLAALWACAYSAPNPTGNDTPAQPATQWDRRLTNLSPTPPRNLSGPSPEAAPRGSLKSALAILVLVLLMLLFWQLFDQYRTTLAEQRQYTEDSAQDLATHLDLTIALSGQLALNQLPSLPPATPRTLSHCSIKCVG